MIFDKIRLISVRLFLEILFESAGFVGIEVVSLNQNKLKIDGLSTNLEGIQRFRARGKQYEGKFPIISK